MTHRDFIQFGLVVLSLLVICHAKACIVKETDTDNKDDKLLTVAVLHRHGDRTPVFQFPTDHYKNRSFWPAGRGQMTNQGKNRMYQLGQYLRNRYCTFLPDQYSESDIYVYSTDTDRTLMSAAATLAGMYPPKGDQIWQESLPWQPIPIHTAHEAILNKMIPGCPKYNHMWRQLLSNKYFNNIHKEHEKLFEYLTYYTGMNISNIFYTLAVRDTLFIESLFNYTLPDWARMVYPDQLEALAGLGYATFGYTDELLRLGTGGLINHLIDHFEHFAKSTAETPPAKPKFLLFSAHDTNVASVLSALGAFDYHPPPYGSTVIFELWQKGDRGVYVNLFYKPKLEEEAEQIFLAGCNYDCEVYTFKALLKRITINKEQWLKECYEDVDMEVEVPVGI